MAIRFYSVTGDYGAFSNFAPYAFVLDGLRWATSEHYFQANKFARTPRFEEIRRAQTPALAAKLGRSRGVRLRSDWESVKVGLMRRALDAKFRQHEALRALLRSTADEVLIEDAQGDDFWGCGADGRGRNMLGVLLMELRATLRDEATRQ